MSLHVRLQGDLLRSSIVTEWTLKWSFVGMSPQVDSYLVGIVESLEADGTGATIE